MVTLKLVLIGAAAFAIWWAVNRLGNGHGLVGVLSLLAGVVLIVAGGYIILW